METAIIGLAGVIIGGLITFLVTAWTTQATLREAKRAERRKFLTELMMKLIEVKQELYNAQASIDIDAKAVGLMVASSDAALRRIAKEAFSAYLVGSEDNLSHEEKQGALNHAIKRLAELLELAD